MSAIARTQEAELIMVGTRGKTGLEHILRKYGRANHSYGALPRVDYPDGETSCGGKLEYGKDERHAQSNTRAGRFFRLFTGRTGVRGIGCPTITGFHHTSSCTGACVVRIRFHAPSRVTKREQVRTELTGRLSKLASASRLGRASRPSSPYFRWAAGRFSPRYGSISVD